MPFTDQDKYFINILSKEKHYTYCKFIHEFPNKTGVAMV